MSQNGRDIVPHVWRYQTRAFLPILIGLEKISICFDTGQMFSFDLVSLSSQKLYY